MERAWRGAVQGVVRGTGMMLFEVRQERLLMMNRIGLLLKMEKGDDDQCIRPWSLSAYEAVEPIATCDMCCGAQTTGKPTTRFCVSINILR